MYVVLTYVLQFSTAKGTKEMDVFFFLLLQYSAVNE